MLVTEHYLHNTDLVGERLRYVAEVCSQWVAVDWHAAYGHPVLLAESFVDSPLFRGTCYKASGWTLLGQTQGYRRARQEYYVAHDRPKQLWVKELQPGARTILRGRNLSHALQPAARHQPSAELERMRGFFAGLPDWRARRCPYAVSTLVTVAVCALLTGVGLGQRDLATFAADLTSAQMTTLKFPHRGKPRRHQVPCETTWTAARLNAPCWVGKTRCWVRVPPLMTRWRWTARNCTAARAGKSLAPTPSKRVAGWNRNPSLRGRMKSRPPKPSCGARPLRGCSSPPTLCTPRAKPRGSSHRKRGADYLLTVKSNPPHFAANVRQFHTGRSPAFSPRPNTPLAQTLERNRDRIEARTHPPRRLRTPENLEVVREVIEPELVPAEPEPMEAHRPGGEPASCRVTATAPIRPLPGRTGGPWLLGARAARLL